MTAPSTLRVWMSALRPATLTAAVGPVAVGTALAAAEGRSHVGAALAALFGATWIQIGTNLHNDAADFERGADTAERLGPARATQRGWLSARQVRAAMYASFALATLAGLYLVGLAGWPVVVIGVLSIASAVAYTGGPLPLGYVGLGDAFVLLFFGVVAVCGTYFVQTGTVTLTALLASVAVGTLATAILVVNNLRDRRTDRHAGKRTLVVRFGARFGHVEFVALLVVAYLLPVALFVHGGATHLGWLLPLLSLPLAWREARAVLSRDGEALNPHLGGTARVGLLFNLLLALGVAL
jgi:1,4-dihydroxy-2-naphthoate octaprenyltransferase